MKPRIDSNGHPYYTNFPPPGFDANGFPLQESVKCTGCQRHELYLPPGHLPLCRACRNAKDDTCDRCLRPTPYSLYNQCKACRDLPHSSGYSIEQLPSIRGEKLYAHRQELADITGLPVILLELVILSYLGDPVDRDAHQLALEGISSRYIRRDIEFKSLRRQREYREEIGPHLSVSRFQLVLLVWSLVVCSNEMAHPKIAKFILVILFLIVGYNGIRIIMTNLDPRYRSLQRSRPRKPGIPVGRVVILRKGRYVPMPMNPVVSRGGPGYRWGFLVDLLTGDSRVVKGEFQDIWTSLTESVDVIGNFCLDRMDDFNDLFNRLGDWLRQWP